MAKEDMICSAAQKLEATKKYNKTEKAKKYMSCVIVSAVLWFLLFETVKPPLRFLWEVVIPEVRVICGNSRFMFLLSNIIIAILSVMSGMFTTAAPQNGGLDFYAEFIRRSSGRDSRPIPPAGAARKYERSRSENMKPPPARNLRRSATTITDACPNKFKPRSSVVYEGGMSDEELKKRVEDFIANFNRQLRLQSQQSCVVR